MKKILIFASFCYFNSLFHSTSSEMDLLQVIFIQAERYPDKEERMFVGSDSYDSFFQNFDDYGQLTKVGESQLYNLGKELRIMYDKFLGVYKHKEVHARSTAVDRAKVSLSLVMSGLYPVTENTSFCSPIPINYNLPNNDFLFVIKNPACRQLELDKLPNVVERMQPYQSFYEELKTKTNISAFELILFPKLYNYVQFFLARGLPYPNWCSQECYGKLEEISKIYFEAYGMTVTIKKTLTGPIIDEILRNIKDNQKLKRKVYVYSGHSMNVASFVQAHDPNGIPTIPDSGAALFIETLKKADNQTYIKMNYWTGVSGQKLPLKAPNCEHECLLDRYIELMQPIIPNEHEKMCYSSRNCN